MTIVYEVTDIRHRFDVRHCSKGRCHVRQYVWQCECVIAQLLMYDVKLSGKVLWVQYR